jgi:hypothetical protein
MLRGCAFAIEWGAEEGFQQRSHQGFCRAPSLPTSMPIGEFPACGGDRALPVRVALRMLQGREFEPEVRPNSWRWTHPR